MFIELDGEDASVILCVLRLLSEDRADDPMWADDYLTQDEELQGWGTHAIRVLEEAGVRA